MEYLYLQDPLVTEGKGETTDTVTVVIFMASRFSSVKVLLAAMISSCYTLLISVNLAVNEPKIRSGAHVHIAGHPSILSLCCPQLAGFSSSGLCILSTRWLCSSRIFSSMSQEFSHVLLKWSGFNSIEVCQVSTMEGECNKWLRDFGKAIFWAAKSNLAKRGGIDVSWLLEWLKTVGIFNRRSELER